VTFIYQEERESESQDFYCITQLPFPTFWGGETYSIVTKEGDLYLIDGGFRGEDSERISTYIEEKGGKVKGWILTHPHVDHIGAFLDYMKDNSHKVETVYYSPFTGEFFEEEPDPQIYEIINNPNAILFYEFLETMETTKDHVTYLPMKTGDKLMLGELLLECFFSFDPDIHDVNGNSLVFTLTYEDFCLALTGDMTEATYEKMKPSLTDSSSFMNPDILQIPHHGYMAGIASDILYRETAPDYVLLDCTVEEFNNNSVNIRNHVQMIEELGIKVIKRFEASEGNKIIIYTDVAAE
ncbi:MAG: MBL fold metallo-hydrolase, partial [Lachnospiraceae bacterium]|nr:MBL fold metallo-hydrolase [Lachnospiraceae bacterium]